MAQHISDSEYGNHIWINGERHEVCHHPHDFTVIRTSQLPTGSVGFVKSKKTENRRILRLSAAEDRDSMMEEARKLGPVYHVYLVKPVNGDFTPGIGEVLISDQLFVMVGQNNQLLLDEIAAQFKLQASGSLGTASALRLTAATGENTLKTANRIALIPGVDWCEPERLLDLSGRGSSIAFDEPSTTVKPEQWYLDGVPSYNPGTPNAGIDVSGAWHVTKGAPDIVLAIIDDGFALDHPAFSDTIIHSAEYDFKRQSSDPSATQFDNHGTPVASLCFASQQSVMKGIAPNCSFLPIRIDKSYLTSTKDLLDILSYVSQNADVAVLCAEAQPTHIDYFNTEFRKQVSLLLRAGGKRKHGLILVVSAGNNDAPTFLSAHQNKLGVSFALEGAIPQILPGNPVYSDFATLDGTIVVSAHTSFKRKAGYSNWGENISICAPSNNFHEIDIALRAGTKPSDPKAAIYMSDYPGRGVLAAINPGAVDKDFPPLSDRPGESGVLSLYTGKFGGTSASAPLVASTIALMLSVNPTLRPTDVLDILTETAIRDLDLGTTPSPDPNLQGLLTHFIDGRSLLFGAGRINCSLAVQRASTWC